MRQRQGAAAGAEARTIDVLTEIATRFYLGEESQIEIARDLGLDPSTVSRYLKRAREEGIVHVEIRPPRRADVDLGREVAASYGLARVVVAPTDPDLDSSLGPVAAEFIDGLLRSGTPDRDQLGTDARGGRPSPATRGRRQPEHRPARRRGRRPDAGHPGPRARPPDGRALPGLARPLPPRPGDRRLGRRPPRSCSPTGRSRRHSTPPGGASSRSSGSGRWTRQSTLHMGGHVPRDDWARLHRGRRRRQRQHPLLRRAGHAGRAPRPADDRDHLGRAPGDPDGRGRRRRHRAGGRDRRGAGDRLRSTSW